MSVQRDQILVVDIEASCWKGHPPPGEQQEIIEVGVCVLDVKTLELSRKRSILVKPTRSKISEFCTELTTLTQEQVDTGVTFEAACAVLRDEYEAKSYLWSSWGDYDRKMFWSQCKSFGVEYPFSNNHVNLKRLFSRVVNNKQRVGMTRALAQIGLTLEGVQHRGDDDAWNIARILAHVLKTHGTDILLTYW